MAFLKYHASPPLSQEAAVKKARNFIAKNHADVLKYLSAA
jgi:hypothetical protein